MRRTHLCAVGSGPMLGKAAGDCGLSFPARNDLVEVLSFGRASRRLQRTALPHSNDGLMLALARMLAVQRLADRTQHRGRL